MTLRTDCVKLECERFVTLPQVRTAGSQARNSRIAVVMFADTEREREREIGREKNMERFGSGRGQQHEPQHLRIPIVAEPE